MLLHRLKHVLQAWTRFAPTKFFRRWNHLRDENLSIDGIPNSTNGRNELQVLLCVEGEGLVTSVRLKSFHRWNHPRHLFFHRWKKFPKIIIFVQEIVPSGAWITLHPNSVKFSIDGWSWNIPLISCLMPRNLQDNHTKSKVRTQQMLQSTKDMFLLQQQGALFLQAVPALHFLWKHIADAEKLLYQDCAKILVPVLF